jgi:hypothetical protein
MNIIDYTNTIIGPMTVVREIPTPDYYQLRKYECKCACGNSFLMTQNGIEQASKIKENYSAKCACRWTYALSKCDRNIILTQGVKIGNITIIESAPTPINIKRRDKKYFLGKCTCGNEKLFSEDLLKKNIRYDYRKKIPLSCGCMISGKMNTMDVQDLIGKKIGRLTILSVSHFAKSEEKIRNATWYQCRCECGNLTQRRRSDLLSKRSSLQEMSCGCTYYADKHFIGEQINNLQIIDKLYKVIRRNKYGEPTQYDWNYKCKCECGKIVEKTRNYFSYVTHASCGCWSTAKCCQDVPLSYIKSIQKGALERGYEYNVSDEYLAGLYIKQNKRCALTGFRIPFFCDCRNKNKETLASLDRINSDKGYVEGNVQWVHKNYNMLKNNWDNVEFIDMCKKVAEYNTAQ